MLSPQHIENLANPVSLSHWGAFEAEVKKGRLIATRPLKGSGADPDMIGAIVDLVSSPQRIDQPYMRAGWLRDRDHAIHQRGREKMVPVNWDTALSHTANELERVRDHYGHQAIFAGSYGWSSAGRFHHARTQTRRFFGAFGGFTDQTGNYSWGAAQIILQKVLGNADAVSGAATAWRTIAEYTDVLVAFGGLSAKNWRVTSGGAGNHTMPDHIRHAHRRGTKFIVLSPLADDIPQGSNADWIAPRPGSDTAIILSLCYEMIRRGRADEAFLAKYCTGAGVFRDYLLGKSDGVPKSLDWASAISDVPKSTLHRLADQIASGRVMLTASWSLQRAHRGEQPYWALIALAAILGQIGQPGGGFTFGYGSLNAVGDDARKGLVPLLETLGNPSGTTIPVARFADMLDNPGQEISFDGRRIVYPETKLIYWAGGNPFHHAQDLFRLERLWAKPETIIVHEQTWTATALRADIVLPATTTLERNDIGGSSRDPHIFFMPKLIDPVGKARNDYDIFSDLAGRVGCRDTYTENRTESEWLAYLWHQTEDRARAQGLTAPDFEQLKKQKIWFVPKPDHPEILLSDFIADPQANALTTASGKIELNCTEITASAHPDIASHPEWRPPQEWIGEAKDGELALLSRQPAKFLHSQLNRTGLAQTQPPSITINPAEAEKRGLTHRQRVTVRSKVGGCTATVTISQACRDGVAIMETGPHFIGGANKIDPGGNPNALTRDFPSSRLSQATAAQSCLVTIFKCDED